MAAYQSLAFSYWMSLWQLVDEVVGAGGDDDDGDERRAQDAQRSGHVLKWQTYGLASRVIVYMSSPL